MTKRERAIYSNLRQLLHFFHIVGGGKVYNFTYLLKNRVSRARAVDDFRLLFVWFETQSADFML